MYRLILTNMTGGKEEREALRYRGDHGLRARILAQDILNNYSPDAILITGCSAYQLKYLEAFLWPYGYERIIAPDFSKRKDKFRFTCLTCAYVLRSHKAKQIRYDEVTIKTIYRYAGFTLSDGLEIRVVNIPCADSKKPHYDEQLASKEAMLNWEKSIEEKEISEGKKVVVFGDWNTEIGNLECHDIFDALPYEKLLDEPTWRSSKIDNVLVSPNMKGRVKAQVAEYNRYGQTTDHAIILATAELPH
ncbi:MAG: endonuclease/exonuclease/phosphatase family protein [Clostridiales bacterium]|nr:endonuclease/exonuclease/phosphatase family protein [Clostridiales bacterium]